MRRNFSSPGLVRALGALDPADAGAPAGGGQDFAERLSPWVGVFEAGTLHAVLQAPVAATTGTATASAISRRTAAGEVPPAAQLQQARALLARGIAGITPDAPADIGGGRPRQHFDPPAPSAVPEPDFATFRQRYLDQQRHMDLMIGPLRDSVRQALSAASPALRQLAVLDAVWEQMLAGREQRLMATVPARLKRRFETLRREHLAATPAPADGQAPATATAAAPWLHTFCRELQQVLLAELDTRLAPVTGLVEAFEQDIEQDIEQEES